jgi:septum formation protein
LILASSSPRRRDLLRGLGLSFEIQPPEIDESPRTGEAPSQYVERLARLKAEAVATREPGALVLGADTAVILDGEILGKPRDAAQARAMLERLSGRGHTVLTAIALAGAGRGFRLVEARVDFRRASPEEIGWYVQTGEPLDKAGSYALQGSGGFLVSSLHGSVSGAIGLPLSETVDLLEECRFPLPWRGG